jgi:deoxyxylulose-5-phosphate synthase
MSTEPDLEYPLLDALGSPEDVKDMDNDGLRALAAEIRAFIIDSVIRTGGHLGAGLGVVELTLALFAEYQFNQHDKLVWDVGHQCYPHKILTGRRAQFPSLRQWKGLSGFPDPHASPYDTVKTGHGGTSISTRWASRWRGAAAATTPAARPWRYRRWIAAGRQRVRGAQPRRRFGISSWWSCSATTA